MKKGNGKSRGFRLIAAYLTGLVLATGIIGGCNFFEWANPSFTGYNTYSFTEKGQQLYNDGDYSGSMDAYSNALTLDPYNSKARVGFARAAFWYFLPDFMLQLAVRFADDPQFGIDDLFAVIGSPAGQQAIHLKSNSKFYEAIVGILDSPYGIINGQGDGVISHESLEANLMLIIAYAFDLSFSMLDYNNDGVFGSNGDIMTLSNTGTEMVPVLIINFEEMLSNINGTMTMNESNSGSNINDTLKNAHDSLENMLEMMKFLSIKMYLIDNMSASFLRPKKYLEIFNQELWEGLTESTIAGGFENLYDSMLDASTNSNSISEFAGLFYYRDVAKAAVSEFQTPLNDLHNVIVGTNAFFLHVSNFVRSDWDDHNGGLKNLTVSWINLTNIGTNNLNTLLSNLTNSYSMSELSNLLLMFEGMFGS
ncbi:MAG: hypothetical protein A2Y33_08445 [Spirochaetes bacterium GWF1_51_8]|nr:MAG: hypothetical protein A2Y33_08445 [Spirochaetes bacterium GWF1_51_8]